MARRVLAQHLLLRRAHEAEEQVELSVVALIVGTAVVALGITLECERRLRMLGLLLSSVKMRVPEGWAYKAPEGQPLPCSNVQLVALAARQPVKPPRSVSATTSAAWS